MVAISDLNLPCCYIRLLFLVLSNRHMENILFPSSLQQPLIVLGSLIPPPLLCFQLKNPNLFNTSFQTMFSRALPIFPGLLDSLQLGSVQLKYVFLEVLDHIALSHHLLGNQERSPLPTSLHSLFLHLSQPQQKAHGPQ